MRSFALAGLLLPVAVVAAACGTTPGTAAPVPSATAAPSTAKAKAHASGIRGRVTTENGSTWTVTTADGRAFTVTLTARTAFGTRAAPGTAAQFPVGSEVRVAGTPSGASITAVRITAPAKSAPATPEA